MTHQLFRLNCSRIHTKLLYIFIAVYAVLLIYASLMPFDFSFEPGQYGQYKIFWNYWPINPHARISGSDVLSNLVLYVPLGWMIMIRLRLSNYNSIFSIAVSGILCSLISLFVETLQIFIVSRVASGSDWLLNTISGVTGSLFGLVAGEKMWISGIDRLKNSWDKKPAEIAVLILAGLAAADALSPFMPTILLKQVGRNFKRSFFLWILVLQFTPGTGGYSRWVCFTHV